MTDVPHTDSYWEHVWKAVDPEARWFAIDRHGMRAVFTTCPYLHPASGKWVPTGQGKRHDMGLMPVRPDEDQLKQFPVPSPKVSAEEAAEERRQALPPDRAMRLAPIPGKQPSEQRAYPANPTAEELAQANLRAMGEHGA